MRDTSAPDPIAAHQAAFVAAVVAATLALSSLVLLAHAAFALGACAGIAP